MGRGDRRSCGGNPRVANGYRRRMLRERVAARGEPCALCGKPIDYTLTTFVDPKDGKVKPHPWRYELDEIVPVSAGGDPLDPENVQPTHRICNELKGDGRRGSMQAGKLCTGGTARRRLPVEHSRDW